MLSSSPKKVLIIDDDEDDFFITSEYIRSIKDKEFEIDWCFRYGEALDHLANHRYDIYFIDYFLGAKTGLNLIQEASTKQVEEPMVLLTGKGNQAIDLEAMQAGAMDYLVKTDLNEEKMERCIRYALERAASIKALKANERKYRLLFERSKESVFITDSHLIFRDLNEATALLLRLPQNQLVNRSLLDFLETKDIEHIRKMIALQGEISEYELEIRAVDNEVKNCIISLTKEMDPDGTITINGILHDITQLKKAERVTLQAEKLAATGRLVQTLAHEVRNPLNNINLAVEQLSHDIDSESDAPVYMDIIHRNSKRIGDIITELLISSRPADMLSQKLTLQQVMDESINSALDRLTLQKIKLNINYTDNPLYILGDPQKLKIAFLNIIINAIEAMEEEKGSLEITINQDLNKHQVRITDNGSGISPENLSRLFEPYFTSKRNGLGLGLAATLNILQSHKAHIEVSSALGKGTSFSILFKPAE